jgi:hypothetical protein
MPNIRSTSQPKPRVVAVPVKLSESDKRVSARLNKSLDEQMRELQTGRKKMQLYVEEQIRRR